MKLWIHVLILTLVLGFCVAGYVWLNKYVYDKHYEITENDVEEMLEETFLTTDITVKKN